MESENDKQNLDELIASILTDGHIDCLERALNNVQSSSLLSSTSSSATKVVTKVVKFLMDGGANTCLTKFANRLWSRGASSTPPLLQIKASYLLGCAWRTSHATTHPPPM